MVSWNAQCVYQTLLRTVLIDENPALSARSTLVCKLWVLNKPLLTSQVVFPISPTLMAKSSNLQANLAQRVAQTLVLLGKSYFVASLCSRCWGCSTACTLWPPTDGGHDAEALIKPRIKHCTGCTEESQQLLKTKDLLPTIRSPLNEWTAMLRQMPFASVRHRDTHLQPLQRHCTSSSHIFVADMHTQRVLISVERTGLFFVHAARRLRNRSEGPPPLSPPARVASP